MTDRYRFLKTADHDGTVVALIADQDTLGESGIQALRNAFQVAAAPRIRAGVLSLTADEIARRLPELESQGMTESVAAFRRAHECIQKRVAAPKP